MEFGLVNGIGITMILTADFSAENGVGGVTRPRRLKSKDL